MDLNEKAKAIVFTSNASAKTIIQALKKKTPLLDNADIEHWEFIVTVAGVFFAISRIGQIGLTDNQQAHLMKVIENSLHEWHPDGLHTLGKCTTVFCREIDRLSEYGIDEWFITGDAIGIWIILNVLGRNPQSDEEVQLIRTVGGAVMATTANYWE